MPKAGALYEHAPFGTGDCSLCHKGTDPKNPGPVLGPVADLCKGCHEQIQTNLAKMKFTHAAALDSCTNCHNPHSSPNRHLLNVSMAELCFGCHDGAFQKMATQSAVKHKALTTGSSCTNCHDPHASNVEHLLIRLPYDLCIDCHNRDDMKDERTGRPLTNMKKWLKENPAHHGPVEAKDCSACHSPHGSDHQALLLEPYPPKFYSPFDPKNYSLCFRCHNPQLVTTERTTTLTKFRNGDVNLHFKHVNKAENGRTCRACHEVHASKLAHQIREKVPYGSSGWMLPINFQQTPTGGSCTKTCHATGTYNNGGGK